jgi:hypothetical protein
VPTFGLAGGDLSIQGTPPCAEDPERFVVRCEAGTVRFEYEVNEVPVGLIDTTVGCGAPNRVSVHGNTGDDEIDLSGVTLVNGFTGIAQPNLLDGGYGRDELIGSQMPNEFLGGPDGDLILARNGVRDTVECGEGTDAVQTDRTGTDTLSNCELVDLLPTPAPGPAMTSPTPTGRRAAAQRRCRSLKHRRARRKCFRHAGNLPV